MGGGAAGGVACWANVTGDAAPANSAAAISIRWISFILSSWRVTSYARRGGRSSRRAGREDGRPWEGSANAAPPARKQNHACPSQHRQRAFVRRLHADPDHEQN